MRSNGATHIGNDTFIIATQDDDEHLFLFTSAFPAAEQRAAVRLERRVRLTPKSTLMSETDVLARYLDELARQTGETDSVARITAKPSSASRSKQCGVGFTVKHAANVDTDLVVSSASSSADQSEEEDENDDDAHDTKRRHGKSGAREALHPRTAVRRHALFASPNGHQVVAICNQPRHHYIFDVGRNGHDVVCEFETDGLVRSVVWHPEQTTILLLLLAGGELVCYDTAFARFGVVYPHAIRVDFVPLLQRYARADDRDDRHEAEGAARANAHASTDTTTTVEDTRRVGAASQGALLPLNAYGQPDHTYGWPRRSASAVDNAAAGHAEARTVLALTERPSQTKTDPSGLHLEEDIRTTMSMHLSSLLRPPSALQTKVSDHRDHGRDGGEVNRTVASLSSSSQDRALADAEVESHVDPRVVSTSLFQPAPQYGRDIIALTSHSAHHAPAGGPALAVVRQGGREEGGRLPLVVRRELVRPTYPFDLVDMAILPASRSRPLVLLLLSSSGDIFSLKLDDNCLPRRAAAQFPDGRLQLADTNAPTSPAQEGAPILHHIVSSRSRETDEQALRLAVSVLDADTGLCVVAVCWSSGALKGVYMDEPDLIARDDALARSSGHRASRKHGFTVQLGPALPVASLLSPAVASSSHLVHMETQGNVLLIRYGQDDAAAYVVALPVWDVNRQGWNYWQPPCCESSRRAQEALRLPIIRREDGAVPAPLALRLPYDVTGASVALGVREILIAPELARMSGPPGGGTRRRAQGRPASSGAQAADSAPSPSSCPRHFTVVADVASLLTSAILAGGTGWSFGPMPVPRDHGTTAAADTRTLSGISRLLDAVADCHRSHLCAQPHAAVASQLDNLSILLERLLDAVNGEEQAVHRREVALRERVTALSERTRGDVETVTAWQNIILNALVNRRGVEALVTGNDRLGEVHAMLNEYHKMLEAHLQKESARCTEQRGGG